MDLKQCYDTMSANQALVNLIGSPLSVSLRKLHLDRREGCVSSAGRCAQAPGCALPSMGTHQFPFCDVSFLPLLCRE
jgi:hypothetical protein